MGKKGKRRRGSNKSKIEDTGALGPAAKNENENKKEEGNGILGNIGKSKESEKNMTKDQRGKTPDKEESACATPATAPPTLKISVTKNTKKANKDSDKPSKNEKATDNGISDKLLCAFQAAYKLVKNTTTKIEQDEEETEKSCDILKSLSFMSLLDCASVGNYQADPLSMPTQQLKRSEIEVTDEQKLDLNIKDLEAKLGKEMELKEFTYFSEGSEDIDDRKLNFDQNVSKVQQDLFSEDQHKLTESEKEEHTKNTKKANKDSDKPSKNEKATDNRSSDKLLCPFKAAYKLTKNTTTKIEQDEEEKEKDFDILKSLSFMSLLDCASIRNYQADPLSMPTQQLKRSEIEVTDEQKLDLNIKDLEAKLGKKMEMEPKEFTYFSEGSEDIDDGKLNFDQNVSKVQQDLFSEDQHNLTESEKEEHVETVYLKREVSLFFEFDTFGNKKVLVNDMDYYSIDENQKITFDIGDGNVRLLFTDNKVFISSQEETIDCSMRKNRVMFSITNSITQSDISPEGSNVSDMKDTAVIDCSSIPCEDINAKSDSDNIPKSTSETDSPLVPRSTQQSIQSVTENFLKNIRTSCEQFENDFLESLKLEKIEDMLSE